jgi:hypothetical protein
MNITEHRLNIAHQLEELSEESLCELEKIIAKFKFEQKSASVWLGIEKWREQARFNDNEEVLTDEMIASWRDKKRILTPLEIELLQKDKRDAFEKMQVIMKSEEWFNKDTQR